jgi:hypothetical protein
VHKLTGWSKDVTVEVAGRGVVAHTGSVALRALADRAGLTGALSSALIRRGFDPVHDRGRVLTDTAVMIADGGRVLSDLAVLRDQGELFGSVASDPTLWRTLAGVDAHTRDRLAAARANTRRHVWAQIVARHGAIPASKVADRDLGKTIVIRLDATLVVAHSDKELAAGTYKGSWGHHPLTAWCDNTGENLAVKLRTGSAGSNTVVDHLEVLTAAIAQIPAGFRRDLLITCDGAGATKDLLKHITTLNAAPGRRVHYSVGFDLDERCRAAIGKIPDPLWENVINPDGSPRDLKDAGVVELTGLLRTFVGGDGRTVDQLKTWPADMRVIVRRRTPPPRCPAVPVRGSRRLALPGLRHQHPGRPPRPTRRQTRPAGLPGGPSPRPRPGRGLHPQRQEHRAGTPAVQALPAEPGLVHRRGDRRGPAGLAAASVPDRRPGQGRAEDLALPAPAHRRPRHPRPTPTQDPHPRNLALGPRVGHRTDLRTHPANASLNPCGPCRSTRKPAQPVELATAGTTAGPPTRPHPENRR